MNEAMFCIVQSPVCAISSTVCLCYSSIYVSSSLSLVPQPQQYKVELAKKREKKKRKETKEVCDCNSVSLITTQ